MRYNVILALGLALVCASATAKPAVFSPEYDAGWTAYKAAEKADGAEEEQFKRDALEKFEQGCAKNDPRACRTIAEEGYLTSLYGAEIGARRKAAARRAAELYSEVCTTNSATSVAGTRGCNDLARFVMGIRNRDSYYPAEDRTDGLPEYVAKAAEILTGNCALDPEAIGMDCMGAVQLLRDSNPSKAKELRNSLCDIEAVWACHDLGKLSTAEQRTLDALSKKCGGKDGDACFQAGVYWYRELPTFQGSGEQARSWFQKGCAANHGDSCGTLGAMLARGEGGAKNLPESLVLTEKACKLEGTNAALHCGNATKIRALIAKEPV